MKMPDLKDKKLVLVNKSHPISDDFIASIELADTMNFEGKSCQLEKETLRSFEKLRDALQENGIMIALDSGYRSVKAQQALRKDFTRRYCAAYTLAVTAAPGTSEHHTGLALDIVLQKEGRWITENDELLQMEKEFSLIHSLLPSCGFILRYPKEKEEITGYAYEPWHFRYIGEEAAAYLTKKELTLEEAFPCYAPNTYHRA